MVAFATAGWHIRPLLRLNSPCAVSLLTLNPHSMKLKSIVTISLIALGVAAAPAYAKTGTKVGDIKKLTVWGNHSPTMYADYRFATVNGKSVKDTINDHDWNANVFLPTVGKRGAAIIAARGLSSAASAANAAIDHMRDWALGTNGKWVTMGIPSQGWYGIPKDVMFGFPVTCENGEYKVIEGLEIDAFSQECINKTLAELEGEKDGVKHLL